MTLSGREWVNQFPTSRSLDDLKPPFRAPAKAFVAALQAAGATVKINATLRPPERGFLMHWAFMIARMGFSAAKVPADSNIDINWVHATAMGSKQAAEEMVVDYGIARMPSLTSLHYQGLAIDMSVSWTGALTIKNKAGANVQVTSAPRSGENSDLIRVGAGYGVVKALPQLKDPPHWSFNGH